MNTIEQCVNYYEKHLTAYLRFENENKDKEAQGSMYKFQRDLLKRKLSTIETTLGLTKDEVENFEKKVKEKLGI